MNKIGIELAQEGLSILRGTKAFVIEQAPDFIRQVLAWKLAESVLVLVLSIAGLVIAALCVYHIIRLKSNGTEEGLFLTIPALFSGIPALCCFFGAITDILKIHYAPKLFLMEYFAGLVK